VSGDESELVERDDESSSRCLLDCLCKDEMKCCKSAPKMNHHIDTLLDHPRSQIDNRSLNRLTRDKHNKHTDDNGNDKVDDDDDVGRTYCSLPNIVPARTYSQQQSSQHSSKHSLRTNTSDTVYVQVSAYNTDCE